VIDVSERVGADALELVNHPNREPINRTQRRNDGETSSALASAVHSSPAAVLDSMQHSAATEMQRIVRGTLARRRDADGANVAGTFEQQTTSSHHQVPFAARLPAPEGLELQSFPQISVAASAGGRVVQGRTRGESLVEESSVVFFAMPAPEQGQVQSTSQSNVATDDAEQVTRVHRLDRARNEPQSFSAIPASPAAPAAADTEGALSLSSEAMRDSLHA
jgi:hypothetical protein